MMTTIIKNTLSNPTLLIELFPIPLRLYLQLQMNSVPVNLMIN